ncbi:hypothetical protein C8F04DRAFT_1281091 [Mycena alexandri]|uniref:40S ribosomal protein S14 n=1 Tax=Mycena alexandri TaxID=1745969 RepID=A0AAD6RWG3_9AGAR|nr:hypothetical protein C8F04DRAFT_1281091 [Mycena alexandri]
MLEAIELAGLRAHIWGPVSWVQVLGFGREGEKSQGAQGGERVPRSQAERERVFAIGVAHIFASFNDTFVHVTDMSGKEAISLGMNVKVFAFLDCRDNQSGMLIHVYRRARAHTEDNASTLTPTDKMAGASPTTSAVEIDRVVDDARFTKLSTRPSPPA